MKIAVTITRVLMGLLLLVSVIGYFFNLMPEKKMSESATLFMTGMFASGYLFPLVKIVELLVAFALLANRFVALALVIIFPITLNIFLFHAFMAPEGLGTSAFLLAANIFLAYHFWKRFEPVIAFKA